MKKQYSRNGKEAIRIVMVDSFTVDKSVNLARGKVVNSAENGSGYETFSANFVER